MIRERWHKKDVSLTWRGKQLGFAVAQELFSSHEVDAGSRALLRALDLDALPTVGHAVDYGCGYGVLGLAFRESMPGWSVDLIDRDALAVSFAQWNAERLGVVDSVRCLVGLGPDAGTPADLVLWNVPGKIGLVQQRALTERVVAVTRECAMIALVVVTPLADAIRDALTAEDQAVTEREETTTDHVILIARKTTPAKSLGDPFDDGVFDREPWGFEVDDLSYDTVPVQGLPDYNEYGFDVQLVMDLYRTVSDPVESLLVLHPGQGHVPVVGAHVFRPARVALVDRDLLALRASLRVLATTAAPGTAIATMTDADLAVAVTGERFGLAVLMCEDQVRNEIHQARLEDLAALMTPGGSVIVAGKSSVVSRFSGLATKTRQWKARDKAKRGGFAAARLTFSG
jgi:16S rRNA G1207 methylase RsmC